MFDLNKKDQTPVTPPQGAEKTTEQRPPAVDPVSSQVQQPRNAEVAVIGRSIQIDGDLRGEEDLRIEGDISGTIQLPNHSLTIGTEGRIRANAYAKSVTVDGEIKGDLYSSECVSIRANARVEGNVIASRVSLEEGARFKGSIDMDPESVERALADKAGPREKGREPNGQRDTAQPSPAVVSGSPPADSVTATSVAGGKKPKAEPAH